MLNVKRTTPILTRTFSTCSPDYLVLGAGSAGSVVTHRLREAGANVALVDAGGWGNTGMESNTGLKVRLDITLSDIDGPDTRQ